MAVPVSACLIVKNDPAIDRAVASIRPFVDEVCIVDTGSTDGTDALAERIGDRYERFTACNFEDGAIADFAAARTRSFDLASHETVLWIDSDDVLSGGERIQDAIAWAMRAAGGQPWRARFPYEYDRDARERCISYQLRERIVWPRHEFRWVYRVHEGLTCVRPTEWQTIDPPQPILWQHRLDRKKPRSARNLRILRDHVRRVGVENVDPKTQLDLGLELAKSGDHALALAWLTRFVQSSDLEDERMHACLVAADALAFWPGREQDAALWGHRAVEIAPTRPDGYMALAKLAYQFAAKAKDTKSERRQLERVVHFGREAIARAAAQRSTVPVNPLDTRFTVHALLADAHTRLGGPARALPAARACATAAPDDAGVRLRLRECERAAARARGEKDDALDLVIVCGLTPEAWDPESAAQRGIGGSETAVIEMAKRLAARGARVRVYCRCDAPGLYDGVEYRSMGQAHEAAGCDLLIAWRNATLLESTSARVKWLWLHDTGATGANAWNLSLADQIVCVSRWHAEHVTTTHPSIRDRVVASRNGIDPERFTTDVSRNPHKALYTSSADRGLEILLTMWPRVRARVPDAELHACYGFANVDAETARAWTDRIAALSDQGVVHRGRLPQDALAREMLGSGVWLHPSWCGDKRFEETSCIGAMEAQAAGCRIVASTHGALPETIATGTLVPGDATSEDYQAAFVEAVACAMTEPRRSSHDDAQRDARARFDWNGVADAWFADAREAVAQAPARLAGASVDPRPVLHMILAPEASGHVVMDAAGDPGSEAHGGGCRVGFLGLAKAMAARGEVRVRTFSTFRDPLVIRDGVEYRRLDTLADLPDPDIALAYYDTSPLAALGSNVLRIASHHTYQPYMHFDAADVNTAPSDHAMATLRDRFDPTGRWCVLPNGCAAPPLRRAPVRGRILYHTSPDRGLHHLLEALPAILDRVPDATLHVVGPVRECIEGATKATGAMRSRGERLAAALRTAEATGALTLLGRLARPAIERELAQAHVFAFPCDPIAPCETFSLSIMECCAAGIPVVLRPADSLESIYRGVVAIVDDMGWFTDAVADVLTDDAMADELGERERRFASHFTFDAQARALSEIIDAHLTGRRSVGVAAE